ncbi:hypothetical protein [Streptomyces pseudogriseolus]|uniref:hypothetical protein n=1 Tax=Streptomyces pseudogriseolus TaxID=36817 RepID=UPI003FA1FADB
MTDHARTHIKAMIDALKEDRPEKLAQPAGLFTSGMLTGLAAALQILNGSNAEAEMERVGTNLAAAVGLAYLNGTLPAQPPATTGETDRQLTREEEIRGVQGWMALDVHRALGLPVDEQSDHQGHRSWSDWWATLCGHISQRTLATRRHLEDLAVPDSLTFHNARQWSVHPELARPETMFFPIRYGAVLAEAHPTTPNDPPYMIDLSGYEDGDPVQERVLRLIVHRSLATRLARDITALEPAPAADPATPKQVRVDAVVLGDLIDTAMKEMVAELGEGQRNVEPLEALAYHAAGLSYALEEAKTERDGAYRERAHLVALLAAMTDGAVIAPAPDVDEPGWQIAYLTIGGHQATWHISPRDADLFAHIEPVGPDDPRAQWDGHGTELKYARIAAHAAELAERCGPACAEGHTYAGRCEGAHPHPVDDSTPTTPDLVHPDTVPQVSASQRVDEPCAQHPTAPVIGGICGGCTQYPTDMTSTEQPDVQQ